MSVWAKKKQFIFVFIFLVIAALAVGSYLYLNKPLPTCFDKKQNQDERGVDCGGVCSLACRKDIIPIRILWSRIFPLGDGTYDVMALVENQNKFYGVESVNYQFNILDDKNRPLTERKGATFLNPSEKFIIFEPRINTHGVKPGRAFLYFDNDISWVKVENQVPEISIGEKIYVDSPSPRLKVSVRNNTLLPIRNMVFASTLTGSDLNAFAGSVTTLDILNKGESKDIYFTWPISFGTISPLVDIYPRLNLFETTY